VKANRTIERCLNYQEQNSSVDIIENKTSECENKFIKDLFEICLCPVTIRDCSGISNDVICKFSEVNNILKII